jgi:tetratricopeptide (TPR) repeat protein
MVERFGEDVLARMLAAYADGLPTAAAIERSCGVTLGDFEKGYAERLSEIAAEVSGLFRPVRKFTELTKAHEEDPQSAEAATELAVAYLQRKEYPAARKLAEEALAVEANHQLASFVLAKLSLVVGERSAAVERLAACLDEENPRPEVLQLLATLRLGDGDADEAMRLLKIGEAKHPGDPDWTRRLAAVALKRGDSQELAGYLRALAKVEGDNLVIRKKLALLAAERGDHVAAARWAEDATFIDVLDLDMHILHARSLAQLDRPTEAAAAYEICTDLAPGRREIRLEWAKLCLAAGQGGQAKAALRPLLEAGDPAAQALAQEIAP